MVKIVDAFKHGKHTYVITKYEQGGDLLSYMKDRGGASYLDEESAHFIFTQLIVGLKNIHSRQIVHRDIKHMNIFLSNTSSRPRAMIGDFGAACYLREGDVLFGDEGTVGY